MWSTPSSIARRSTPRAAVGSRGGPNTPGPASCIAPKPMRLIGLSPKNVAESILVRLPARACRDLADLEQVEAERLDLRQHAEERRAILDQTRQHRLAALQVGHHRGKG